MDGINQNIGVEYCPNHICYDGNSNSIYYKAENDILSLLIFSGKFFLFPISLIIVTQNIQWCHQHKYVNLLEEEYGLYMNYHTYF